MPCDLALRLVSAGSLLLLSVAARRIARSASWIRCHQIGDIFLCDAGNCPPDVEETLARHPYAEGPIRAWFAVAAKANWANPTEIKRQFGGTVDFVGDNRVIFDPGGNKYRLVVHVSFAFRRVLVKFIGTHAEYDRIDPKTVSWRKN